jgi:hypothetical protein
MPVASRNTDRVIVVAEAAAQRARRRRTVGRRARSRRPGGDLVGDPHDVGRGVLPVAVGAHHVLPGVVCTMWAKPVLSAAPLPRLTGWPITSAAEGGARRRTPSRSRAAAVVDHDDRPAGAAPAMGDEVDEPVSGS